jgi:hypothetical protein
MPLNAALEGDVVLTTMVRTVELAALPAVVYDPVHVTLPTSNETPPLDVNDAVNDDAPVNACPIFDAFHVPTMGSAVGSLGESVQPANVATATIASTKKNLLINFLMSL